MSTKKNKTMTKKESITDMRSNSRSIITPSHALEIAEPWGLKLDDLPIEHWNEGADWDKRTMVWSTGSGVGVQDLAPRIVKHVGLEPDYSCTKLGRGAAAEERTFNNCQILEDHING